MDSRWVALKVFVHCMLWVHHGADFLLTFLVVVEFLSSNYFEFLSSNIF
jgi:hypothetical protein